MDANRAKALNDIAVRAFRIRGIRSRFPTLNDCLSGVFNNSTLETDGNSVEGG